MVNINGIHKIRARISSGKRYLTSILSQQSIFYVQEIKSHDHNQLESFQLLLHSKMQHKEFVNDQSSAFLHIGLRLLIHDTPVYIHSVYSPVKADERVYFLELLLFNTFD